jgi:ATP-dependent DNA ligase
LRAFQPLWVRPAIIHAREVVPYGNSPVERARVKAAQFEGLDELPKCDGELVVLDDAGRPLFDELLFGRGRPIYVAFDLLIADDLDLRPLPLKQRKAPLARLGEGAEGVAGLIKGLWD